ncbi:MAG: ribulose-phosphate 3-epimerase [Clostridiales bacterium]|nr:ribulose-phosphate 3-epimerase [Clostridiales bacterium]
MIYISPSILAADFANLESEVKRVERAGASMLHLDVMDGVFVPNISFGPSVIAALRRCTDLFFDVHLMIVDPIRYIQDFVRAGADIITLHYESCDNPAKVISIIKAADVRASVSISPGTPYEAVLPLLDRLDMVLVMTVEPGFGGQKLIPSTLEKVRQLRRYANSRNLKLDIEVDGGITLDNIGLATRAGANVIVSGSTIFGASRPSAVISKMFEIAEKNPFAG